MLGGYQQGHPLVLVLRADTDCRIVGHVTHAAGRLLLRHHCTATMGVSGAPLQIENGGKTVRRGIDVAAEPGMAVGVAVVLDEARKCQ